jgi:hypothetical protein
MFETHLSTPISQTFALIAGDCNTTAGCLQLLALALWLCLAACWLPAWRQGNAARAAPTGCLTMAATEDEQDDPVALYHALVARARALPYYATAWPPKRDRQMRALGPLPHRIEVLGEAGRARAIGRHAAGAAPLADARLGQLMRGWLALKASDGGGSAVERRMYAGMGVVRLVDRLLTQRPLVFFKSHDEYVLRAGETGAGGAALDVESGVLGGFALVGTDEEAAPLTLDRTLSYDEMALGALLSVATPTLVRSCLCALPPQVCVPS